MKNKVSPPPPGTGKTKLGIPAVFAVLEVIVVLGKAPRDRFGRAQFDDHPYRDAAENLREFASTYGVGGSRDTLDQIGNVCAALLERLESAGNLFIPPSQWLMERFADQNCEECGRGARSHTAVPVLGNWFAHCIPKKPRKTMPKKK